jgi:hypothetical protein
MSNDAQIADINRDLHHLLGLGQQFTQVRSIDDAQVKAARVDSEKRPASQREPAKGKPRPYAKSLEGNGSDQLPTGEAGAVSGPFARYEEFLSVRNPLFG